MWTPWPVPLKQTGLCPSHDQAGCHIKSIPMFVHPPVCFVLKKSLDKQEALLGVTGGPDMANWFGW